MDETKFFSTIKTSLFGGKFTQDQVNGLNAILHSFDYTYDLRFLAYMLATTFHETNQTMEPIHEYGGTAYFTKMYDIRGSNPALAARLGNIKPGDGARYAGRGYVQLTGRANYDRAGRAIGVDLVGNPDLAMDRDIASRIMNIGMIEGWFTSKKLSDYFNDKVSDPFNARSIINGDKNVVVKGSNISNGRKIANYYDKFLLALKAATV